MFCKNCGKELIDGALFCSECGEKLENTSQQTDSTDNTVSDVVKKHDFKRLVLIIGAVIAIVIVVIIIISVFLGNKLSVEDVKSGYLTYYSEDKTIGEAFSNYSYFTNLSWQEFESEERKDVVELNAEIEMFCYETETDVIENITFQFYQDNQMEKDKFELYGIFIQNKSIALDDYDVDDMLDCIYNDEIFLLISSDYGIYY